MAKKIYTKLMAQKIAFSEDEVSTWRVKSGCIVGTVSLYIIDGVPGTCDPMDDDYIYSWAAPRPVD